MKLRPKDIRELERKSKERGGMQTDIMLNNRPIGKPKIERKPAKEIKVHAMIGRNIYINENNEMRIENGWVYPWNWRNHE